MATRHAVSVITVSVPQGRRFTQKLIFAHDVGKLGIIPIVVGEIRVWSTCTLQAVTEDPFLRLVCPSREPFGPTMVLDCETAARKAKAREDGLSWKLRNR